MAPGLGFLDWCVVGVYLGAVALVGFLASARKSTAKDYFLGSRSVPWWAAALSIIATETSAVTLIGVPRYAWEGDWSFLQLVLGFVLGRLFLAFFFVEVFHRKEILTVYGFLEDRFGGSARTTAALFFLIGRVLGSAVRLYAGCLAVEVATGLPLAHSVLILGGISTAYTISGGIRAVVWTDVLLGLTFMASGLVAVLALISTAEGGISGILSDPSLGDRLRIVHTELGLARGNTLLAGLLGGFFLTLATHGTDQDVAQRILTCRNSRGGSLSLVGSAALILPLMTLFLAVGTLLGLHYRGKPMPPGFGTNPDHLFPLYIVSELPQGVAGFVMAGLFAATVSSFASVLNALASTTVADFLLPLSKRLRSSGRPVSGDASAAEADPSERRVFFFSRASTLVWGAMLMVLALAFRGSRQNVVDLALSALTYFYGALLGAFLLGVFTRRGTARSIVLGMTASVPVVLLLQLRRFLDAPSIAPDLVRTWLEAIPPSVSAAVLEWVPALDWKYWIIVGTAVSFGIGALVQGKAGEQA